MKYIIHINIDTFFIGTITPEIIVPGKDIYKAKIYNELKLARETLTDVKKRYPEAFIGSYRLVFDKALT